MLEAQDVEHALQIGDAFDVPIDPLLTDVVMPRLIVHHRGLDSDFALLAKPITPDALLHKVREVLDARRAASPG